MKKMFIPIHLGNHWVLGFIDVERKTTYALDNTGNDQLAIAIALKTFVHLEHRRFGQAMDDSWRFHEGVPDRVPIQTNMIDCGVFVCYMMNVLSLGERLDIINPNNHEIYRRKLAMSIIKASL